MPIRYFTKILGFIDRQIISRKPVSGEDQRALIAGTGTTPES
jgi:hypothetical protein